jgi:hypothetical protein
VLMTVDIISTSNYQTFLCVTRINWPQVWVIAEDIRYMWRIVVSGFMSRPFVGDYTIIAHLAFSILE